MDVFLNDLVDSDIPELKQISHQRNTAQLNNVAQILFLQDQNTSNNKIICLINCHIFWKPAVTNIKLLQVLLIFFKIIAKCNFILFFGKAIYILHQAHSNMLELCNDKDLSNLKIDSSSFVTIFCGNLFC